MIKKEAISDILNNTSSPQGRRFAFFIQVLILASLFTFSIETLPNLSTQAQQWLYYFEILVVAVFTVEYGLRVWVAQRKLAFIFSFYGIIDLVAILPFYLSAGLVDLRSLRAFRLLRLLRLLKLARYNTAMARLRLAIKITRGELIIFLSTALILIYLSAVGIYYFEHDAQPDTFKTHFDAMWWAVATLTTVGYGDVYPITDGGRFFTFVVLMIGLGIVAVPAGMVASAFSEARRRAREERDQDPG